MLTAAISLPPAAVASQMDRTGQGDLAAVELALAPLAPSLLSSTAIAPPRPGSVSGIEIAAASPFAGPGLNRMNWAYEPEVPTIAPRHLVAAPTMVAAADPVAAMTVTETVPAVAEEAMAYANPVTAIGDIEQPFQALFNPVVRPPVAAAPAAATPAAPTAVARATTAPRTAATPVVTTDHAWVSNPIPARARSAAERRCLAAAIYFEARGEPVRGQMAVAQVVINRLKNPAYPDTVCGVVYQNQQMRNACQFSFACDGMRDVVTDRDAWALAQDIANNALRGRQEYLAEVGSSTHYHANYVHPNWADDMQRMSQIGVHIFYRTYGGGWI